MQRFIVSGLTRLEVKVQTFLNSETKLKKHMTNGPQETEVKFKVGDLVEDRWSRQYIVLENIKYSEISTHSIVVRLYDILNDEYDRMLEGSLKLLVR